jgi:hypothetical protein
MKNSILMFQRTQSFHFRRGRDATTATSTTARTQSFRFVRRGGRKNNATTSTKSQATRRDFRKVKGMKKFRRKRLKDYMASLEKHWDDSEINKNNETGEYEIITLYDEYNHKFSLNVSQEDDTLSVTTCIYTCTSALQSTSVMKKALELNYFVGDRKGYLLAIDPSSSSSSVVPRPNSRSSQQQQHRQQISCSIGLQQLPIIELSLCFSRPMAALGGNDNFFDLMGNFTEVASNIQSQLEDADADESRLGMAPRTITDTSNGTASLTSPPTIIAQLMGQTIDENAVLSPPLKTTAARISSCSKVKPRERSAETFRKSFVKTSSMRSSQFLSPEEARVYELYATHKSKQRRINSSKKKKEALAATAIAGCRTVTTDTKNATKIVNPSPSLPPPPPRPPQRTMSLPIGENFVIPSPPPPPPTIDTLRQEGMNCFNGKTPVISNKRIKIADYTKKNYITTSMTTKPPPSEKKYSPTILALLTTTQRGNHHQPTPTPSSKRINSSIINNSNNINNDKEGKLFRFEKTMTMTTLAKKGGNADDDDDGNHYLHNSRKDVLERNLSTAAGKRSSLIPPRNGISSSTGDDGDKKDRESSRFEMMMTMKVKMGSIVNDGDDCSDDDYDENYPQKSVSEPKLSIGRSNTRFLI